MDKKNLLLTIASLALLVSSAAAGEHRHVGNDSGDRQDASPVLEDTQAPRGGGPVASPGIVKSTKQTATSRGSVSASIPAPAKEAKEPVRESTGAAKAVPDGMPANMPGMNH